MGCRRTPPQRQKLWRVVVVICPPTCYNTISSTDTDPMTLYDVICPSAPWENTTTDEDRAWDLCYSLSEDYGYAQVRQNGVIIGEYRDGR